MAEFNFAENKHSQTSRNYLARVLDHDKAECAVVAKQWGKDYWDGDRKYGYGGHKYDGRWLGFAQKVAEHYGLTADSKVLDVGCGKGYLVYELTRAVPGISAYGVDISSYAIENAKEEVRSNLVQGSADQLPFRDKEFDLVISLEMLHLLPMPQLAKALTEVERVSRKDKYIIVPAWRNDRERVNYLYWQLASETFLSLESWRWLFKQVGYTGDCGFDYYT